MTSQVKGELYYSITGEPFGVQERTADNIEHTNTVLNIYTKEEEEVPNTTALQKLSTIITELSLPYPIKKGQFFNSESYCRFFNEAGELLTINGVHLFKVSMIRDSSDFERLHVKFEKLSFEGKHEWKNVEVEQL
ncbi:MAG: hypothetical protein WC756_01635 [Taibaiella sp.]|jgi:hypothetical protein